MKTRTKLALLTGAAVIITICVGISIKVIADDMQRPVHIYAEQTGNEAQTETVGQNDTAEYAGQTVPGDAGYEVSVTEPSDAQAQTQIPTPTQMPIQTPVPVIKPAVKSVKNVEARRYSTTSFKITWNKVKKAKFYHVYIAKKRDGRYRLAGTTRNTWFRVKKRKKDKDYYVYVTAGLKKKVRDNDSKASEKKHFKTKEYTRKTIFAGDSITQEIALGDTIKRMKIGGKTKVVAAVGRNTITFHTKRVFSGGRTALSKVIAEKPYRVYMMLGINEIHYRPVKLMIAEYKDLIEAIHEGSPGTEIVVCAVSPVTKREKQRAPGYWQIPVFNKKLKKLANKMDCRYWDYTDFLKDSEGFLKTKYASADGYHWTRSVYAIFADKVHEYEKSIDG